MIVESVYRIRNTRLSLIVALYIPLTITYLSIKCGTNHAKLKWHQNDKKIQNSKGS